MIKAGFIGFGRMGMTHFSILNSHPHISIQSACDSSSAMMSVLKSYVPVRTYPDAVSMLDKEELDFVVISTPSDSHAELIKTAIARDLHVFTEKPFVLSVTDGEAILGNLKGKSLVNQVGYVNRFNEVFEQIKCHIDNGIIGDIKSFSSEMYAPTVLKDTKGSWRSKKHSGGGCLYELGCHCIDLAIYLFGKPDRVAGSFMQSVYSSDVDDMVTSTLVYDTKYTGSILVNWCNEAYRKPTNIIKAFGTKGSIVANKHAYRLFLKNERTDLGFYKGWNTRYITEFAKNVRFYVRGNEFTRQLDYFVDCIGNYTHDNISSFSEALKTDMIIEDIIRDSSAIEGSNAKVGALLASNVSNKPHSFFKKFIK